MLDSLRQILTENGDNADVQDNISEITHLLKVRKDYVDVAIDIPSYDEKSTLENKYNNPAVTELDFELLDIVRLATSATDNIATYPLTTPQDLILENEEIMKAQYESCRAEFTTEESPSIAEELRGLATLVYPIVLTYVLEFFPDIICVALVGHIDSPKTKEYVAAAALSNMMMNTMGLSIGYGILSALDTLFTQAYGAKRHMKLGIYAQTALIVVGITLLPVCFMNWHCEDILLMTGQNPEVARIAGEF